jgi:cell division protein FtsB
MKIVIGLLLALFLALQYRLWFAEGNLIEVYRLERDVSAEERRIDELEERNRALEAEVEDLKQGLDAIEARARSELGMIREDETFFQLVEPEPPSERPAEGQNER